MNVTGGFWSRAASLRACAILFVLCVALPRPAPACGPFLDASILDESTEQVLGAPAGHLATQLGRLGRERGATRWRHLELGLKGSLPLEVAELRALLQARGLEAGLCDALVATYETARLGDGGSCCCAEAEAEEAQGLVSRESPAESPPASSSAGILAVSDPSPDALPSPETRTLPASAANVAPAGSASTSQASSAPLAPSLSTTPAEPSTPAPRAECVPAPGSLLPALIPAEFGLYLEGARAWRACEFQLAADAWERLLALPEDQRRHRSVWAAYMLGRVALIEARQAKDVAVQAPATEAMRWFVETRALIAQGCTDPLGLGAESLGWEGLAALLKGEWVRALHCYEEQYRAGDPSAFQSLRTAARRLLEQAREPAGNEALAAAARDPLARRLVSAYLVTRAQESRYDDVWYDSPWVEQNTVWRQAMAGVAVTSAPDADLLAWISYTIGDVAATEAWLARADEALPMTWWLRGKLALRGGRSAEAQGLLARALTLPGLDVGQIRRLQGELGRVALANDRYSEALEAWLEAGEWEAAAHVAERLLSTAELKAWVDQKGESAWIADGRSVQLRRLLARRLAREGNEEAAPYFAPSEAARYLEYLKLLRRAHDSSRSFKARGRSFMAAARLARYHGMELLGTEYAPDFAVYDGLYETGERQRQPAEGGDVRDPLAPTERERELMASSPLPQQGRRFHYRYRAAELAWLGASLMPNDSEETARMLVEAGSWLKHRDPVAADPFFKTLVVRCPHTALGREAASLNWFPEQTEPELEGEGDWGLRAGWLAASWVAAILGALGLAYVARRLSRAPKGS